VAPVKALQLQEAVIERPFAKTSLFDRLADCRTGQSPAAHEHLD
jgi:hypothetical protein